MINIGKKDCEKNPLFKSMITNYNLHMGSVDKVIPQLHGLYTLGKSYKWYRKLAFRLLSLIAPNLHIL